MRKTLLPVLIALFLVPQGAVADAKPFSVFAVSVVPDKESLASGYYKRTGRFYVDATVRNASTAELTIVVWTNHGWSWTSNNAKIMPEHQITNNSRSEVVLEPGDEYTGRIEVVADHKDKKRPLVFRLGFTPEAEEPVAVTGEARGDLYWSDPVTLVK